MLRCGADTLRKLKPLDYLLDGHNGFVAGGCFKDILSGKTAKDIDIFFRSEIDYEAACTHFGAGNQKTYENENATGFALCDGTHIDLCKSAYGTPEEVLSRFDFTVSKFAYFKGANTQTYGAICHDLFFTHLESKALYIDDRVDFPISTLSRMFRYTQYGYRPTAQALMRVVCEINKLNEKALELPKTFYDERED